MERKLGFWWLGLGWGRFCLVVWLFGVAVAEVFFWGDVVADELFELFHFWEATLLFSVPDGGAVYGYGVDASGV